MSVLRVLGRLVIGLVLGAATAIASARAIRAFLGVETVEPGMLLAVFGFVVLICVFGGGARRAFSRGVISLGAALSLGPIAEDAFGRGDVYAQLVEGGRLEFGLAVGAMLLAAGFVIGLEPLGGGRRRDRSFGGGDVGGSD